MLGRKHRGVMPRQRDSAPVSNPRQNGAIVRQKDKPWEKLGISRATWYRYGKPTEKAVYADMRWEKRGGDGTLTDALADERAEWPPRGLSLHGLATAVIEETKKNRPPSMRTFQRTMRVMQSELWPYAEAGILSIAQADRTLGNPH